MRASAACAELKENKLTECLKSLCRISIAHDRDDVLHKLADALDELGMLGELDSQRTLHLTIESNMLQCFQVLVEAHARIASRERSVVLAGLGERGNAGEPLIPFPTETPSAMPEPSHPMPAMRPARPATACGYPRPSALP